MCIGGSPKMTAPELPPPPPPPPTPADPQVKESRQRNRQAAALASGRSSTIATSPLGITGSGSTTNKRTLGA